MENVQLFFDNKEIEFYPVEDFAITYEKTTDWIDAYIEIEGLVCNIKIDKRDYDRLKAKKNNPRFFKTNSARN